jgi:hypothetical protein
MLKRLSKSVSTLLTTLHPSWKDSAGVRRAPRIRARLPLRALILGTEVKGADRRYVQSLGGYTRDISSIGFSTFLPDAPIDDLDLMGKHRRLKVVIEMPPRPVEVFATAVHQEWMEIGNAQGYLIGARITKMKPDDRRRFLTHLSNLDQTYMA